MTALLDRWRGTPGTLTVALVVLIALGVTSGVAGVVGVLQRASLVEEVATRSGRLSVAAQDLYRALSDADASAASAFLSNGLEPATLRQRYETDINDATAALAVVSAGAGESTDITTAAVQITAQLPLYTGLVEAARVYNRQGLPLGAAYLREASGVMRERLLPAAEMLYRAVSADLARARAGAGQFPWLSVGLGVLTLIGLAVVQRYLFRRTNRVFNIGLLVASGTALVLLIWLSLSAVTATVRLDASRTNGSAQVDILTQIRTTALQARTDESLTLVARGNGAAFEKHFVQMMTNLTGANGLLAQADRTATDQHTRDAVRIAVEKAKAWNTAHTAIRKLDDGGQYNEAVAAAISTEAQSTATIFTEMDAVIAGAIVHNGQRFDRETARADRALGGLDLGVVLLTVALTAGAGIGLQRRLAEYR